MASLSERIIDSAKLDVHTYEEVEADTNATGQALMVVVLSSIAQGIGTLTLGGLWGLLAGTVSALIGWFIWAFLLRQNRRSHPPYLRPHRNLQNHHRRPALRV